MPVNKPRERMLPAPAQQEDKRISDALTYDIVFIVIVL